MSALVAEQLLEELRARGVELRAEAGLVRFRPQWALTPELAARARACLPDLVRLLEAARPLSIRIDGAERPVVWLDVVVGPPAGSCPCCRTRSWWRLRGRDSPAPPWTCGRCHPPSPAPEHIEWAEGSAK